MPELVWTNVEKKIARNAFELALGDELEALVVEFKRRANLAKSPEEIWEIRDWLNNRQLVIDKEYDYRYSQLLFVFGNLIGKGRIQIDQLDELATDKLAKIALLAGL